MNGSGLDPTVPTTLDDGRVVTAAEALTGLPSRAMRDFARLLSAWTHERGGVDCDVVGDYRMESTRPGGLMVRWGDGPSPHQVAEAHGPIPSWIQLRHDTILDGRYIPEHV